MKSLMLCCLVSLKDQSADRLSGCVRGWDRSSACTALSLYSKDLVHARKEGIGLGSHPGSSLPVHPVPGLDGSVAFGQGCAGSLGERN